jgi:prepilin-type N-terminal cleavage/methylation domain-containing protein
MRIEKPNGFTLIELLVVVAIIGILSAVGVVAYNGYTSSANKNVVKQMHSQTIKFIKAEMLKCEIGETEVMYGYLDCSERFDADKIGDATQEAFSGKFLNPFVSYRENVVAGQDPHQNGVCIVQYNSGGILVSNIDAGSGTMVRVSTCYGETTRLYEEWLVY